jgi:hypothetical protein
VLRLAQGGWTVGERLAISFVRQLFVLPSLSPILQFAGQCYKPLGLICARAWAPDQRLACGTEIIWFVQSVDLLTTTNAGSAFIAERY